MLGEKEVKRNKKRNNRNYEEKRSRKIVRCSLKNKPVFEYEICNQFISRVNANDQKNCKNCKHAY